jgi:hypothetical protein
VAFDWNLDSDVSHDGVTDVTAWLSGVGGVKLKDPGGEDSTPGCEVLGTGCASVAGGVVATLGVGEFTLRSRSWWMRRR